MPGICNKNDETTVLAHLGGGGMGTKRSDLFAAFCCSACHDYVDGRAGKNNATLAELWHLHGVMRTQEIWLSEGLIKID